MEPIDFERVFRLKILPWIQGQTLLTPTSLIKFTCDISYGGDFLDWNETFEITDMDTLLSQYPKNVIVGQVLETLRQENFRIFASVFSEYPQYTAWGFEVVDSIPEFITKVTYSLDMPKVAEYNKWFSKEMRVKLTGKWREESMILYNDRMFKITPTFEYLADLYRKFILSQQEFDHLERVRLLGKDWRIHIHVFLTRAYPMIYVRKDLELEPFEYLLPPERIPSSRGLGEACLACGNPVSQELYFMCKESCPNPKVLHMKCIGGRYSQRPSYERLDYALRHDLSLLIKCVEVLGVGLIPDFTYEDSYVADLVCKE